jgi:hypothetical protein
MTAPDTTIEPPRKIFDALDMVDMWLMAMIRSTAETIQLNIPRDLTYPAGYTFTVASCVSHNVSVLVEQYYLH